MSYRLTNSTFYTPTQNNAASSNIAAVTFYDAIYTRAGDNVIVSGRIEITATAPGATSLGINLPIASDIQGLEGCCGTANASTIAGQSAAIVGSAANNCAVVSFIAVSLVSQNMYYQYQYLII